MANNSDNDSDNDLLELLVGNDEQQETETPKPKNTLKELQFNFLNDETNIKNNTEDIIKDNVKSKTLTEIFKRDHCLSSDDEDKDYFDKQSYSESGQEIKQLLKEQQSDKTQSVFTSQFFEKKGENINKPKKLSASPTVAKDLSASSSKPPSSVYNDPIFGFGITKPLVSSAELVERMHGRKAVTIATVKQHITSGNVKDDWVIAGVLVNKSNSLVSQKGNQYCIWKLSDLSMNMTIVTLFLFSNAYKTFWKTSIGMIVGILNPNILENKDNNVVATLSIDNPQKIMILGTSRDMGKCKSVKKNGEPCNAIVNIRICEHCVYHVKQEYSKCSRRSELQTNISRGLALGTKKLPNIQQAQKKFSDTTQSFVFVTSKRNEKSLMKERAFLEQLRSGVSTVPVAKKEINTEKKSKACLVDLTTNQAKKDYERLSKLKAWNCSNQKVVELPGKAETTVSSFGSEKPTILSLAPQSTTVSSLGTQKIPTDVSPTISRLSTNPSNGFIDLSTPIVKKKVAIAKQNALEWIRKNGGLKKTDPNKIHPTKDTKSMHSNKRKKPDDDSLTEETDTSAQKKTLLSNKFKELMEVKSHHTELIEKAENEDQEKYFNKLEVKERMEEKMLSTFKVNCKAVRCGTCKYISFSASDLCKEQRHPLKVIDAVKRFFKCADCGNRTVSLDRIPAFSCKKCNGSHWVKTAMMDEKRTMVKTSTLSIRGDEEKFSNSVCDNANINLLVPE